VSIESFTIDQLIERLAHHRSELVTTLEMLHGYGQQVDTAAADLENPLAVKDYLAFFTTLFSQAVTDCQNIAAELTTEGIKGEHIIALKKLAGAATVEARRCLQFRDKWINKPLPHESMRPLLNDISVTTRDQLTGFKDFFAIIQRLGALSTPVGARPQVKEERVFNRRDLFTRFLKR
jgi:hypothetical protein